MLGKITAVLIFSTDKNLKDIGTQIYETSISDEGEKKESYVQALGYVWNQMISLMTDSDNRAFYNALPQKLEPSEKLTPFTQMSKKRDQEVRRMNLAKKGMDLLKNFNYMAVGSYMTIFIADFIFGKMNRTWCYPAAYIFLIYACIILTVVNILKRIYLKVPEVTPLKGKTYMTPISDCSAQSKG